MIHRAFAIPFTFVLAGVASSLAQVPPQSPQQAKADQPETVLTGCLRSGGADTSVAGPSGRLYTLEVTENASAPATATPAGRPAPAGTGTASTITYSLSAAESIGLATHVDQVVQLTGRLQAPSAPPEKVKGASPMSTPQLKPGGAHRTFEVSALKPVPARKCS
jgi:hypothetical protein